MDMSTSPAQIATKLLYLYAYKTGIVHKFYNTDHEARGILWSGWYLHAVHDGEIDPTLILFSEQFGFNSVDMWVLRLICFPC
jgi:hypothetical protein